MGANSFNRMEIDAIGEIMNISLGASATAVSTMLGTKVNITTPQVEVQTKESFEFQRMEPAIGVEIAYTQGLDGKNIMMFRRDDVRIIVGMLMGQETPADQFEMDELHLSAICEVMNQMMGSSATALSEFLGTTVNISTPVSFEIGDSEDFKDKYFSDPKGMVVVRFQLEIEGVLKSEFMNIMPISLAKRLLEPFSDTIAKAQNSGETPMEQEASAPQAPAPGAAEAPAPAAVPSAETPAPEPAAPMPEPPAPAPAPAAVPAAETPVPEPAAPMPEPPAPAPAAAPAAGTPVPEPVAPAPAAAAAPAAALAPAAAPAPAPASDPAMLQLLAQMQQTQVQMMELMRDMKKEEAAPREPSVIRPLQAASLPEGQGSGQEEKANQEMLMNVPLEVSVEIGRTRKLVRDILEFTQGSLVVLDKMAGEQVDLFVNGQCIARGDIVVVEDNFGIRITEIVANGLIAENL